MFRNDYSDLAAPQVMEALSALCKEQNIGYGQDEHCRNAQKLIREFFGTPHADVHFLAGGTQTNMTVISYFLRPFEGVIACDTAHINVHETAAVEGSGHKIYVCPNADGKLLPEDVEKAFLLHGDEHMMKPKMVYISDATETGTVYTKEELLALRSVCDKYGLLLFIDGARLGVALVCGEKQADARLIGEVADVFYAGGTKNGLMYGEAVVIKNPRISEYFRYHIKNKGAMLAKGFAVGAQFEALFSEGVYLKLAQNSVETADIIRNGLKKARIALVGNSPSNQIFVLLPKEKAESACTLFGCEKWSDEGENQVIRIVTSFATKKEDCESLLEFFMK